MIILILLGMRKKGNTKLIIVSNRLPVKAEIQDQALNFVKTAGGLATGLDSLDIPYEKHWIGWSGVHTDNDRTEVMINRSLAEFNFHPVRLTEEDIELFYEGYSNSTLWPLFHYFFVYARHEEQYWESYQRVNSVFEERVREIATGDDIIWVQDYHLMLLPAMLREHLPNARIGFFLHIPFPSYELFRTLENRKEILNGIIGADLIGFHTFTYMRHFISSLYRITGIESDDNRFHTGNRTFSVDAFPMGINYGSFRNAIKDSEVKELIREFREEYSGKRVVLSVDRLDYSKGLIQRLEAFRLLLKNHPEWINKVSLVMILVPSRDSVDRYQDLKTKIDEMIGKINGEYSNPGWIPIHYFYKSFSFKELTAFYNASDIALVTPLRDGMNLVAKEFIAAKGNNPGVLVLSEMAGAAIELTDAIHVNPNNASEISDSINRALIMPVEEQRERLKKMQKVIKKQDIAKWADDFIDELERIHLRQKNINKKYLSQKQMGAISDSFKSSSRRLLILDYDGTLVPFSNKPEMALPSSSLVDLLNKLSNMPNLSMAIVSGRDNTFLDKVVSNRGIAVFAEHGAQRRINGVWKSLSRRDLSWQSEILRIMKEVTDSTPGSFIEKKDTAIVWHYRNSDKWLAELRVAQLINKLIYPCTMKKLHLMKGQKIIEVKPSEYNKGTAIKDHFNYVDYDFILAAGDDTTDEDMFDALPRDAITIKIGRPSEKSRYTIARSARFIKFLLMLTK